MSKITVTPEMIDTIAQIQRDDVFGESFIRDVNTLIDEYLLDDQSEIDTPDRLRRRIQLVRNLRYYQNSILQLFPFKENEE